MKDFKNNINDYLRSLSETINRLDRDEINTFINKLIDVYERGGFIYIFGNGGSASTASHVVNDFNKGVSEGLEKRFRFICLNDNVSTMMAVANDNSYNDVFSFQLKNFLTSKDMVIGISGSGNSANVCQAIDYANSIGAETGALVGYKGGKLKENVDFCIHVNIDNMQIVEDLHMVMDHLMMTVIKQFLTSRNIK